MRFWHKSAYPLAASSAFHVHICSGGKAVVERFLIVPIRDMLLQLRLLDSALEVLEADLTLDRLCRCVL